MVYPVWGKAALAPRPTLCAEGQEAGVRWRDFQQTLPPPAAERLVHQLTIGLGNTALAVRRMAENAPTLVVARQLLQAHTALRTALGVLQPTLAAAPDPTVLLHPPHDWAPPGRWQDFLAVRSDGERQRFGASLQQAVSTARQTGEDVLANRGRREVEACLVTTVRALGQVRRQLVNPEAPPFDR